MIAYRTAAVAAMLLATGGCAASADQPPAPAAAPAPAPVEAEYVGLCVDPVTNTRIDDDHCGDHDEEGQVVHAGGGYFVWMHTASPVTYPAVGQPVPAGTGSRTIPKGATTMTRMPVTGGTVTRGGIGVPGGKAGPAGGGAGGKAGGGGAGS